MSVRIAIGSCPTSLSFYASLFFCIKFSPIYFNPQNNGISYILLFHMWILLFVDICIYIIYINDIFVLDVWVNTRLYMKRLIPYKKKKKHVSHTRLYMMSSINKILVRRFESVNKYFFFTLSVRSPWKGLLDPWCHMIQVQINIESQSIQTCV